MPLDPSARLLACVRPRRPGRLIPLALVCLAVGDPVAMGAQERARVPVQMEDLLFVLEEQTADGRRLTLLAATEGETLVYAGGADRLSLAVRDASDLPEEAIAAAALAGSPPERLVRLPALRIGGRGFRADGPQASTPHVALREGLPPDGVETDGVLGAGWFHGSTWTLDHPGRAIVLREDGDLPLHSDRERIPLELARSAEGGPLPSVPLVRLTVAGVEVAAVVATGSAAVLTDAATAAVGDLRPARRAMTRLSATTFDAWRAEHPDWRVVEGAEAGTGEPLLEVRGLRVADAVIERAWVLRTPDDGLEARLGAPAAAPAAILLGGDILREFRVTLDFVGGVAIFEPGGFP